MIKSSRDKIYIILLFFFIASFFSCQRKHEKLPEKVIEITEPVDVQVSRLLKFEFKQYVIDSVLSIDGDTLLTSSWIYRFMKQNNFNPSWTKDFILLPVANSLLSVIDSASMYGLLPDDYGIRELKQKINLINDTVKKKINITRICELNILLTDAFFRISTDLNKGRLNPDSLTREWKGDSSDTAIVSILIQALTTNRIRETINFFEPAAEQYQLLKNHLSDTLDSGQFEKIIVNLERWRWEKKYNEDYYVNINIPSYSLKYFSCDSLSVHSRIIVGKPTTQTPNRLDSKISYFYVYPYWQVPLSISTKEILPTLKKDTSYFTKHNMDLLDAYGNQIEPAGINWNKYSEKYFPFILRQRDGDENTLGVLKFIFSNPYDIYLHDTNARNLFNKEKRSLSHGCIRVKEANKLANKFIDCCVINFNADSLKTYLKNKERKRVNLFNRIPIHIRYYTSEVDNKGIHFYDDIYELDKKMIENLNQKDSNKIDLVL